MSTLLIPFEPISAGPTDTPAALAAKVNATLDDIVASVQTWAGRASANQNITGSFSAVQPRCRLAFLAGTTQSIPNNQVTAVQWPVIGSTLDSQNDTLHSYDNGAQFGGLFLPVANGSVVIPPVAGIYLAVVRVGWATNGAGIRSVSIERVNNGAVNLGEVVTIAPSSQNSTTDMQVTLITSMRGRASGDGLQVRVAQNSGGALDIASGVIFSIVKLS